MTSLTCFERGWPRSHRAQGTTLGRHTGGRGSREGLHRRRRRGRGARRRRGGSRPFFFVFGGWLVFGVRGTVVKRYCVTEIRVFRRDLGLE